MGRTVSAKLLYGFYVDEKKRWDNYDTDPPGLPWETEDDGDLERWWRELNGFMNPHPWPYDEAGEHLLVGMTDDDATRYFRAAREWDETNPPPWDDQYFGSIYSESTTFFAVRGAPRYSVTWDVEPVDLTTLVLDLDLTSRAALLQGLMRQHGVDMTPMGWYLLALEG